MSAPDAGAAGMPAATTPVVDWSAELYDENQIPRYEKSSVRLVFDMTVPVSVSISDLIRVLEQPASVLNVHIRSGPE
jgi:hypothetical protein